MTLTHATIRLENPSLSLSLCPGKGGRIEELIDRNSGRHWAWHPEGYVPTEAAREVPPDAAFDENWEGGWDDVFPNRNMSSFNGFELADHGELWRKPWSVTEQTDKFARLSTLCRTVPATIAKSISVDPNEACFTLRYSITNLSDRHLPFLFKLHPAIPVEPGDRILMPRCVLEPVDPLFSTIAAMPGLSEYPYVRSGTGAKVRMDRIPPAENPHQEFLYASGLHEGWCAIRNERTSTTLRIDFDPEQVPFVWLFMSNGKWRGHSVAMIEPCTNKPYDLDTAIGRGSSGRLGPRATRELEFRFSFVQGPAPE